jgi:hypothetical protein
MKLHKIIEINSDPRSSILIEKMVPYKRSLLTYYSSLFNSEPVLMVTSISNAAQYAKIVPIEHFLQCILEYMDFDLSNSEIIDEIDIISCNSIMLADL